MSIVLFEEGQLPPPRRDHFMAHMIIEKLKNGRSKILKFREGAPTKTALHLNYLKVIQLYYENPEKLHEIILIHNKLSKI